MNISYPHYSMVPKDFDQNLAFREEILRESLHDESYQSALLQMCADDPLFYVNAFCWTYDPRREPSSVPFITYEFQDQAMNDVWQGIGENDALIEKSRDMGASWLLLTAFEWAWHFKDGMSFLLLSRNEDYVDKVGNPKSLMWKIDYLHDPKYMPRWLMPDIVRTKLHMQNLDNDSVIDGESTTGDAGRGDRRTAVLLDEFAAFDVSDGYRALAATRDVTRSRFFNSTPHGANNAFYDMGKSAIKSIRLHWSVHPDKNPGLYRSDDDGSRQFLLKILDESYHFPEDYPFVCDGKIRSPWYDNERSRCASDQEAGQELDIDYLASGHQFFDQTVLDMIAGDHVRHPFFTGEPDVDMELGHLEDVERKDDGHLQLWMNLDVDGMPPKSGDYAGGADVAVGTGATNSSFSAVDKKTGEKVLEYTNPRIDPSRFAVVVVALSRWLNEAFLTWESNGPGRIFGNRVMEVGYRNVYYRRNEQSLSRKQTDTPGWASTADNKRALLGEYRRALGAGDFINHSQMAVEECRYYVYSATGSVDHSGAVGSADPTKARDNHGDRVIADALAWKGVKDRPEIEDRPEMKEPPTNSFAGRRARRAEAKKDQNEW